MIASLAFAVVVSGCAIGRFPPELTKVHPCLNNLPLPALPLASKTADAPEQYRNWIGVWVGEWGTRGGGLCSALIVRSVDASGKAFGAYSVGGQYQEVTEFSGAIVVTGRAQRMEASLADNYRARFHSASFQLSEDGGAPILDAVYQHSVPGVFRRVSL